MHYNYISNLNLYGRGPQTFSCEGHITFPFSDGGPVSVCNRKSVTIVGELKKCIVFQKATHNQITLSRFFTEKKSGNK